MYPVWEQNKPVQRIGFHGSQVAFQGPGIDVGIGCQARKHVYEVILCRDFFRSEHQLSILSVIWVRTRNTKISLFWVVWLQLERKQMIRSEHTYLHFEIELGNPSEKFNGHILIEVSFGLIERFAYVVWVKFKNGCVPTNLMFVGP